MYLRVFNMLKKIADAEYFAHKAVNNSTLKLISVSPAHYKYGERKETKALYLGSAIHCAVLEADEFDSRYAAMPEGLDRRTKEGKALFSMLEASGKTILSADDYLQVSRIAESVKRHETAQKLLTDGQAEVACFTTLDGLEAKCKCDYLRNDGIIIDIKTTEDASPAGFAKSIATYGYHRQAAFYMDCLQQEGIYSPAFIFIAVEKSAPFAVGVYQLDDASIEKGRESNQAAMSLYAHCLATDEWPAYDQSIITLSLPNWAMAKQP
jgi:hypothetical protein